MTVLVIGYGNPLGGDDGAGPLAVAGLGADPRFTRHDLRVYPQLVPELAVDVAAADLVVLVDATVEPVAPGTVRWRRVTPGPARSVSSHHLAPETLLGLAHVLYGSAPPTFLVTVGVTDVGPGRPLSEPVLRALPLMTTTIADLVRRHGRETPGAGAGGPGDMGSSAPARPHPAA